METTFVLAFLPAVARFTLNATSGSVVTGGAGAP